MIPAVSSTPSSPEAIRSLFPAGVVVSLRSAHLDGSVSPDLRRRRRFETGRACAAEALELLGFEATGVGRGRRGEPCWPPGAVGSISHGGPMVVAVAARAEVVSALGVDIEPLRALRPGTVRRICTGPELREADGDTTQVLLRFSAKESLYKTAFAAVGRGPLRRDVEVGVLGERLQFRPATARGREVLAVLGALGPLEGRWCQVEGLVATGVAAPRVS